MLALGVQDATRPRTGVAGVARHTARRHDAAPPLPRRRRDRDRPLAARTWADANATAEIDADGFGGHTPLFGCVVSQPYRCGLQRDAALARLLPDQGADPNARASLRKRLRFVADESMHEYRDVTPLAWGKRFHDRAWVSKPAMELIAERIGQR